jgi:ribosomal protein S5
MKARKNKVGRPKGEKTVVKRIPQAIEPAVDNLVKVHKKEKQTLLNETSGETGK